MLKALEASLDKVVIAYQGADGEQALVAKTAFYDLLYQGGDSETLATMLATVRARVWRWRAIGLTHPDRAGKRLKQSVKNLRSMLSAIKKRDGDRAEAIARTEVSKAAQEVMRLIAKDTAAAKPERA
jgi:DNA-binding GntR family transcriptional regulator